MLLSRWRGSTLGLFEGLPRYLWLYLLCFFSQFPKPTPELLLSYSKDCTVFHLVTIPYLAESVGRRVFHVHVQYSRCMFLDGDTTVLHFSLSHLESLHAILPLCICSLIARTRTTQALLSNAASDGVHSQLSFKMGATKFGTPKDVCNISHPRMYYRYVPSHMQSKRRKDSNAETVCCAPGFIRVCYVMARV